MSRAHFIPLSPPPPSPPSPPSLFPRSPTTQPPLAGQGRTLFALCLHFLHISARLATMPVLDVSELNTILGVLGGFIILYGIISHKIKGQWYLGEACTCLRLQSKPLLSASITSAARTHQNTDACFPNCSTCGCHWRLARSVGSQICRS